MKVKKVVKVISVVLGVLLLGFLCLLGYGYWQLKVELKPDLNKYPHFIGYIAKENALLNTAYSLCNNEVYVGRHHGMPKDAYFKSKKHFRNNILSSYKNKNYSDSGYLNFRFIVNCKGQAGWFEIVEMNLDLEEIDLNDEMVKHLLDLTSQTQHWAIYSYENKSYDYYMYISYRIENGEIVEILP